MSKHIHPQKPLTLKDVVEFLSKELKRQSPGEFKEFLKSTEFDTNPMPKDKDCITWLGNTEAAEELHFQIAVKDEILLVERDLFITHFTSGEIPEEKMPIEYLRITEVLHLFKRLRSNRIKLIAPDAFLHKQVALHFLDHLSSPLDPVSLRKMSSRGVRSEKRKKHLDFIVDQVFQNKNKK